MTGNGAALVAFDEDLRDRPAGRLVVIGSSAGGLDALEQFFSAVQMPSEQSFVIAQHLSPDHPSMIAELLARRTDLHVQQGTDGTQLRAGVVYVVPPNHDATVDESTLHLAQAPARIGPSPSINLLFESAAEHWGHRAVGVILSGTGSDGAQGLREIGLHGGAVLVQEPSSASFDAMPKSAIELGPVDLVAEAAELGHRLDSLPDGEPDDDAEPGIEDEEGIAVLLATVRRVTGIDFSQYKPSTVRRQIQRRMVLRGCPDLQSYREVIAAEDEEACALSANLLIAVTSFFRDPLAFSSLQSALTGCIDSLGDGEAVRIWVPGCATGEEVYSLAMLCGELLGFPADLNRRVKIFGTDLDERSLQIARRGQYSTAGMDRIPNQLRDRYVTITDGTFQVNELIRSCAVFARHDVGADPPLPRMDLISCRNTLIYFTSPLQHHVMEAFAFALKSGGLLFLGASENLPRHQDAFDVVNAEHRVFARSASRQGPMSPQAVHRPDVRHVPRARRARTATVAIEELEQHLALLDQLVQASGNAYLIFDDDLTLVQVVGDVTAFCQLPRGRMAAAGGTFLRSELQAEARALFMMARMSVDPVVGQPIRLDAPSVDVVLHIRHVQALDHPYIALGFEVHPVDQGAAQNEPVRSADFDHQLQRLERQVHAGQSALKASLAELQAANEELEASSEEVQAASEELQASNEELQASNEELQATNEELGTVNQQLRQRSEELQQLNTDLENIQLSLSQGMVIVDMHLRVTRYTPLAVQVFALVPTDVGTSLEGIHTTIPITGLFEAINSVFSGEMAQSIQVSDERSSFLVKVLPYTSHDGRRLGAIISLTDVTEVDALRKIAEQSLESLRVQTGVLVEQAAIDPTTSLFNRRYFAQRLDIELSRAKRADTSFALAWIDVDRFKEVNDERGHDTGDVALRLVGSRIQQQLRAGDVVGRLGGDEFGAIITECTQSSDLDAILERITASLREPVMIGEHEVRMSASVGVALYPQDGTTARELMRAADTAMYVRKSKAGDGFAYFESAMNRSADDRRARRLELENAIRSGEFMMHYQPVIRLSDGQVSGVGSLLRWHHGGRVIPASEFIPFCEETGQIRALGMQAIDLLLADVRVMIASGFPDLKVGLNMSVSQLEDRNFIDRLARWPHERTLNQLIVEIVESVFLPAHHQALDSVAELVRRGAAIAVDDYGSGYSNMRLLESLAPAFIKLDRSFLGHGHSAQHQAAVIRSAVEVSHVVGAQVIAEGIETAEQRDLVMTAGADFVQGNFDAPAMALTDLLVWLGQRMANGGNEPDASTIQE